MGLEPWMAWLESGETGLRPGARRALRARAHITLYAREPHDT